MGINGTATPASTPSYSGVPAPEPTDAGILQTSGWSDGAIYPGGPSAEVLQSIAAPVRVILPAGSNPTVTQVGPQAYSVTLSLSGTATVQLVPGMADAQQNPVSAVAPNVFAFTYQTRQRFVVTVTANGLVTAVAPGSCSILIGSPRNANLPFANAAPPTGMTGCEIFAELQVIVTP